METLKLFQLNLMLMLSGICAILAFFVFVTNTLSKRRRISLINMELSAMFLLIFDRYAYLFRGDTSTLGYYMVRISNFLVFFLTLIVIYSFNTYLIDLLTNEAGLAFVPKRLNMSKYIIIIGLLLIIVSQFTGLYYTFDSTNHYMRSPGFVICYIIPLLILALQFSVVLQYRKKLGRGICTALILFSIVPVIASIIQIFLYGLSLTNITLVGMVLLLYIFSLLDMNKRVARANKLEIDILKEEQLQMQLLFEQTASALVNAIDAKDKYTHGHSRRVAKYSMDIARLAGIDENMQHEIYLAALLHDVGKIGIPDSIINKEGKLTDEEFATIKTHPVIGEQILSNISQSDYLRVGAHYHHERYDGRGYPDGLKGEEIPIIARIIAVADAYDAMTSKRSYREPIPQNIVREELVKGMGTQFDPYFAQLMIHLVDLDSEYQMKENIKSIETNQSLEYSEYYGEYFSGIWINEYMSHMHFTCTSPHDAKSDDEVNTLILFDSLDNRIHKNDAKEKQTAYYEYGLIGLDGNCKMSGVRKHICNYTDKMHSSEHQSPTDYDICAVRLKDHLLLTIDSIYEKYEYTIALPDKTRYTYLGIVANNTSISDITISRETEAISDTYIPRIIEEISFINVPDGDIPNIQIDGWRTVTSESVPISDGLKITFDALSLPTASCVWHCPYISIFSSDDKKTGGNNYHEYALFRLDGEFWSDEENVTNTITCVKTEAFPGWEEWKMLNKKGHVCNVTFEVNQNVITAKATYGGIAITCVTRIDNLKSPLYVALSGDQVALTNIKLGTFGI